MNSFGEKILKIRKENNLTQSQLAKKLGVTDKAVSKWERNICLPDIFVLKNFCDIFNTDMQSLLSTDSDFNKKGENMKNTKFYVCKHCGNLTFSTGNTKVICCNDIVDELILTKATEENSLIIEEIDGEKNITSSHPMTKDNYIHFIAYLKGGELQLFKQYPEWEINVRIQKRGHGRLIWYSPDIGLLYMNI